MQTYPPGTRIGQYEIASRPMMGGMGVVYFALDHGNDGRPVALKTFRPEFLPDRAARDRFLREGTAWVELGSHQHIVRCYEVEYFDPTAFLVLELIAKEQNLPDASLRSWLIPGHPLPIEQALLFALQIARGMQYATEKIPGFVHRDLKPENILVGADKLPGTNINRLRVTDFGLLKTIADGDVILTTNNVEELKPTQVQFTRGAGTPFYMAPEQWKGEPVGVFTDVYAFGCIVYEMLSGQFAANSESIIELQSSHFNRSHRLIPASLPQNIEALIVKCLALEPIQRYVNWNKITDEVERAYSQYSGLSVPRLDEITDLSHKEQMQAGRSYNAIGTSYLHMGKTDMAIGYFEKALVMAREVGDLIWAGYALGNLGNAYLNLGDAHRAIKFFEQCLELYRETGARHGEGKTLGNLGVTYARLGDVRRAIGYYEQQLVISREIGDRLGEGAALGFLGSAYADIGETRRAIGYYEQGLAIEREIGDRRAESKTLGALGNVYADLKESQKAIGYYEQDLEIANEIGDRRGQGSALGNLGIIYDELGDIQRALEFYEQCLVVHRETGDRHGEGIVLGNLGNAYRALDNTKQALEVYEQALIIRREIGAEHLVASVLFNMASLYSQQGENDSALPLAQEAAQIWLQIGNPNAQHALKLFAQLFNKTHTTLETNTGHLAFEVFQHAASLQEMVSVVKKYPWMRELEFVKWMEELSKGRIPSDHTPTFKQQLAWLRQIANQK
jgi:serine/threonine protein kinase